MKDGLKTIIYPVSDLAKAKTVFVFDSHSMMRLNE